MKKDDNIETRVGYVSTAILKEQLKEYIIKNTINNKYEGELQYLWKYQDLERYLKRLDIK